MLAPLGATNILDVSRWRVRPDVALTREAHSHLSRSSTAECGCDGCLNFEAYRDQLLRSPLGELLLSLGIDPPWEAEVYEMGKVAPGRHAYGAWYHFVGELVSGGPAWHELNPNLRTPAFERFAPGIDVGLHTDCQLVRASFKGLPLVQLEIAVEIPSVISTPEPS